MTIHTPETARAAHAARLESLQRSYHRPGLLAGLLAGARHRRAARSRRAAARYDLAA